jgi:hypothetical protein
MVSDFGTIRRVFFDRALLSDAPENGGLYDGQAPIEPSEAVWSLESGQWTRTGRRGVNR